MPPQAIQIVIGARLFRKYVNDAIPVVRQNPFRVLVAFEAHRVLAGVPQLAADFLADGLNLRRAGAAAQHKIIRKSGEAPEVQNPDIAGLLCLGGAGGNQPDRRLLRGLVRRPPGAGISVVLQSNRATVSSMASYYN